MNVRKNSINLFLALMFVPSALFFFGCRYGGGEPDKTMEAQKDITLSSDQSMGSMDLKLETFLTEKGWGYNVFINGKRYIHQTQIPALSGINGFETEAHAIAVGERVIEKIDQGIIPPSISTEEVKELIRTVNNEK